MTKKLIFLSMLIFPAMLSAITLDQAIEKAYKNNLLIKSTKEDVNQAKYGKISAISNFIPDVTVNGMYTRLNEAPYMTMPAMVPGQSPTQITVGNINNWDGKLQVQQPIFTWGKILQGYKIASTQLKISELKYAAIRDSIAVQVINSYYGVIVTKEFSELMDNTIKDMSEHVDAVKKMYNEGIASKLDLLNAETQLANLLPQRNSSHNAHDLALKGFRMLLGSIDDTTIYPEGALKFMNRKISEDTLKTVMYENNRSLKILNYTEQIAERGLVMAKTSNLPTLIGAFAYEYKWPNGISEEWKGGWAVSAVLSWNLFNGGKSYADIKTAKSRLEQIRIAKRQLKDGLDMGLHSLVNSYNKAIEDINAQKLNVEKAKEGLDIAKTQYEQGVITNTDYLDAEVGLMQANLNLLQAEYSAISNYYQIQYLTGNVNF
ncbi:hypothetical protein DRP44_03230 [candidate division TA06 bacterium]|uniref:TolC family protein n=1 Tax=candidate division TA06 bacterium TaxID=2250710 RepID=A0A660S8S3_UNCT6|nr:MAG: hypothetical protein DRP44_03230 [candidate division TA06 bacterium]